MRRFGCGLGSCVLSLSMCCTGGVAMAGQPCGGSGPTVIYAVGQLGFDREELFEIDALTGAVLSQRQITGTVGTNMPRALEFTPGGRLLAFTQLTDNRLYEIDPATAAATEIGQFNAPLFEGGLAIVDETTAYVSNVNTSSFNFIGLVDLSDAAFDADIALSYDTIHIDLSAMALRGDGVLIGLDTFGREVPERIVTIDPATGDVTKIVDMDSVLDGDTAGMALHGDVGYFIYNRRQSNPLIDARFPELWSFDPYTGAQTLIAEVDTQYQINGIAIAPCAVACPADLTGEGVADGVPDGVVTLSDFSFYLTLWASGASGADLTTEGTASGVPDGAVTLSDFSFYLSLWAAGCP